jgi:hypothetical protein
MMLRLLMLVLSFVLLWLPNLAEAKSQHPILLFLSEILNWLARPQR